MQPLKNFFSRMYTTHELLLSVYFTLPFLCNTFSLHSSNMPLLLGHYWLNKNHRCITVFLLFFNPSSNYFRTITKVESSRSATREIEYRLRAVSREEFNTGEYNLIPVPTAMISGPPPVIIIRANTWSNAAAAVQCKWPTSNITVKGREVKR